MLASVFLLYAVFVFIPLLHIYLAVYNSESVPEPRISLQLVGDRKSTYCGRVLLQNNRKSSKVAVDSTRGRE